jgi:nucleoredoxin
VVFVSSDRDEASFKAYFNKEMPWASVPFADRARAQALGTQFGIRGIPSVIVLAADDGHVVSRDARGRIASASSLDDLFDASATDAGGDGGGGCVVM